MRRMTITVAVLLAIGLSTGCNKGKDYVSPDGTKVFGERTLKDGTLMAKRVEFADGEKKFDVTQRPDGTEQAARVEYPNGEKDFDVTWRAQDETKNVAHATYPDGTEKRNIVTPYFATDQNDTGDLMGFLGELQNTTATTLTSDSISRTVIAILIRRILLGWSAPPSTGPPPAT